MNAVALRYRHRQSRMSRVVTITDGTNLSTATLRSHIRRRRHDRRSTRIEKRHRQKCVAVLHFRYRRRRRRKPKIPRIVTITDEPNHSAATSRIHTSADAAMISKFIQLASKRGIAKTLQWQQVEFGAMTASFEYPSIRCYRSSSRYQVNPHRMSCPCLVSFSVGHYDVLVSTPDSMFSVV